jgi:hypothetical protein
MTYIHINTYTHTHTHINIYTYTHTHTHTHTYTHTHTHTCILCLIVGGPVAAGLMQLKQLQSFGVSVISGFNMYFIIEEVGLIGVSNIEEVGLRA